MLLFLSVPLVRLRFIEIGSFLILFIFSLRVELRVSKNIANQVSGSAGFQLIY